MFNGKCNNIKSTFGLSLIEVVVAMSIIVMAMMGVSTLTIQTIQVQDQNKSYLVASMLAQEGLELVRNARDKNWLTTTGANWYDNIVQDGTYRIDISGNIVNDVNLLTDANAKLGLDGSNLYVHGGATPTAYSRLITATPTPGSPPYTKINLKSTIQWSERGRTHTYIAETELTNWR